MTGTEIQFSFSRHNDTKYPQYEFSFSHIVHTQTVFAVFFSMAEITFFYYSQYTRACDYSLFQYKKHAYLFLGHITLS